MVDHKNNGYLTKILVGLAFTSVAAMILFVYNVVLPKLTDNIIINEKDCQARDSKLVEEHNKDFRFIDGVTSSIRIDLGIIKSEQAMQRALLEKINNKL